MKKCLQSLMAFLKYLSLAFHRGPPLSFIIHHHVSLSPYSNQSFPIWILARRRGERVPGRCIHGHKHTHWILVVREIITTHMYSNTKWGFVYFGCTDLLLGAACLQCCFLFAAMCVASVLTGACMVSGAGSSKTMEGWWGCFTAVGGSETDCDPPAKRLSASHGPRNVLQYPNRATMGFYYFSCVVVATLVWLFVANQTQCSKGAFLTNTCTVS